MWQVHPRLVIVPAAGILGNLEDDARRAGEGGQSTSMTTPRLLARGACPGLTQSRWREGEGGHQSSVPLAFCSLSAPSGRSQESLAVLVGNSVLSVLDEGPGQRPPNSRGDGQQEKQKSARRGRASTRLSIQPPSSQQPSIRLFSSRESHPGISSNAGGASGCLLPLDSSHSAQVALLPHATPISCCQTQGPLPRRRRTLRFSNSTNPNPFMMRTSTRVPYLSKNCSTSRRVASVGRTTAKGAGEREGREQARLGQHGQQQDAVLLLDGGCRP